MSLDPANAHELAQIASEIGADVLSGDLRSPSPTGSRQLDDLGLSTYFNYQSERLPLAVLCRKPSNTS